MIFLCYYNIGNADPILLFLPHWPARPAGQPGFFTVASMYFFNSMTYYNTLTW